MLWPDTTPSETERSPRSAALIFLGLPAGPIHVRAPGSSSYRHSRHLDFAVKVGIARPSRGRASLGRRYTNVRHWTCRGRAMRLKLVFLLLLCGTATALAQATPGVVSPTPSSPTGLPAGPTFSSCSYACNNQYLACVNPCSTAAGIAAGTSSAIPGIGGAAPGAPANTSQCFLNCTNLRQTCTLGCSGLPFD